MRNDIRLYIGDKEVEFSADPKLLLNYRETELHNPTIVRNSFTKQITLPGTQRNNDIFGHIWNMERIQEGMSFNPIKKSDFSLYVNDELFQKGYVKLDSITETNNTTEYKITLYGGLGQFFYNLTYDQDDSGNNKKTLASLSYAVEGVEPDLDFTIDKDSVQEAWDVLNSQDYEDRWNVINFCPALNGIPNDFDASKVLINMNGINADGGGGFQPGITESGITYYPTINGSLNSKGYCLGEMDEDLQEWQTRDLRSYNQRPVVSMKRIIDACGLPENNGGYQLVLDPHFFHRGNPYYTDSWVTLPLLKDLDGVGGGEIYNISGASIGNPTTQYRAQLYPLEYDEPAASINNVRMSLSLRFNPESATTAANLYPHHNYSSPGTTIHSRTYVREAEWNSGVIVQMFALGLNGTVVGQSKAYLLSGTKYYANGEDPMWQYFWDPDEFNGDIGSQPEYEYLEGYFKKIGNDYVFVNNQGQKTNINFSFTAPSNFASIILKVKTPYAYKVKYANTSAREYHSNPNTTVRCCYSKQTTNTSGNHTYAQAQNQDRIDGDYSFVIESFDGVATDYEGLFSGTRITKDRLLSGQHTPSDYLLSYAKLFGLYFYYDSTEEASDRERYPSGVVHLMDRDTFYTEEYVDLSKKIDWNKKVDIIPALAASKWYSYDVEHVDSELETGYEEQFGHTYGSQLINTNYNFDSNTTKLYDGNVFKAGIMALEKDKYYKKSPNGLPVYQYNGFVYNLYYRSSTSEEFETYEVEYPVTTTIHMNSVNPDYEFYNVMPLLEFHAQDNAASDGSDVLVFYKGTYRPNADYWLTDDVNEMITLNDASPCWIMTKNAYDAAGNEIAKKIVDFPFFTRDLIVEGTYGNIVHSWNFGHPQVIYSPDTYTTPGDSIYDVCWQNYIRDLYSVNTRKLTCYVRAEMDEHPWPYWFRRFYWFENAIWALNEIKDLNPASFDTCKMEFIKVQDVNNYKLDKIEYQGANSMSIAETSVPCEGGTVHATVTLQTGGAWDAANLYGYDGHGNYQELDTDTHFSPTSGSGVTTTFTVTVPANSGDTPIEWTVVIIPVGLGKTVNASFIQETCSAGSTLELSPTEKTVSSPSGSTTFNITKRNVSGLTVVSNDMWARPSISGNQVVVAYGKNSGSTQRNATISLAGTGIDGPIETFATIKQNGPGAINTNTHDVVFEWNETGPKYFSLSSNDDWTGTIMDNS